MTNTCWIAGDQDEAQRYLQQAIPIHLAIEEKRGLAQLYNVLAGIYYEKNEVEKALVHVEKARELYEAIEDRLDVAVINANLARLYTRQGRFEEALATNQRAIDASRDMGDRAGLERDLSYQGFIFASIGEFDRGLDYYFQAVEIAHARNDRARIADFQAGAAAVYVLMGDDETALAYYDLALPVLLEVGIPYHIAGPLLGKAELLFRRGDWAAARPLCEKAQELSTETELAEYAFRSRVLAARLDYAEGDDIGGLSKLKELLASAGEGEQKAALNYEVWRLTRDRTRAEAALNGYRQELAQAQSFVIRSRLAELQAFLEKYPTV
jgi:tetratricopeptide (TPR) repeat protein